MHIILTVPHDGKEFPSGANNRRENLACVCDKKIVTVKDVRTKVFATALYNYLKKHTCPHVVNPPIVNMVDRHVVDMNRSRQCGTCGDDVAITLWNDFHSKICTCIKNARDQLVLLLDIHGHSHSHGCIEIGYGRSWKYSTRPLPTKLGDMFNCVEMEAIPSSTHNIQDYRGEYYWGGFITTYYNTRPNVHAIQLELPWHLRHEPSPKYDEDIKKIAATLLCFANDLEQGHTTVAMGSRPIHTTVSVMRL